MKKVFETEQMFEDTQLEFESIWHFSSLSWCIFIIVNFHLPIISCFEIDSYS